MSKPLIHAEALEVGYEHRPVTVKLSFDVQEGDYLCVIGENGAGKTTLLKTLLGLIPPISGTIETEEELAKKGLGYLPQHEEISMDFPSTVFEVALSGYQCALKWGLFYTKEQKEKTIENLRRFGMDSFTSHRYSELSGGQRQRVLLCRALAGGKRVLLIDEPVAGLDVLASKEMYQALEEANHSGVSVIMITHDLRGALPYANHVLFVGENPFFGTKEEFLSSEQYDAMAYKNKEEQHG